MVQFDIKINAKERVAYIPKEVVEALGLDLRLTGNRCSAIIYPRDATLADIVRSLKILLADFEHGLEMEKVHFCGQCSHWQNRCLKGYSPHENSHTAACREFLEGRPSR